MRAVTIAAVCLLGTLVYVPSLADDRTSSNLARAKIFLAAADYRHAIDACLKEVVEAPSAKSYTALTYAYQALDGYLEHLAKQDKWMQVEHLYLNLAYQGPQDLTDPPDVLPRIAKELMQQSAQRQSDITAAMANRLDKTAVDTLWQQQTAWRKAHPDDWFLGVSPEWNW
ncbi:MAG TPA: hypothetical protein VFA38_03655 [Nitrospirales bacterium]|nr:hypothetical protein [Nitrospirales bacterium]